MSAAPDAAAVLDRLVARGETLAVAESLTGGLLAAMLTAVPGASRVFRGAVVAYATDLKADLLAVPTAVIDTDGVVSARAAEAMASGARDRCSADWAVSTTGVAGPDRQEGKPPGLVYVGWAGPAGAGAERLSLSGGRDAIRLATCRAAVSLLARTVGRAGEDPRP